jgi:DNA-binding XRE family transcriptional regulator
MEGVVFVLNPKQKKCIEMMMEGSFTQKQMAEALKVSENTICNWKKNDEFMNEYNTALKSNINQVAAKAFSTQMKLLNARSEMVRYMVSKDILDRAGFKATENINLNGTQQVILVDEVPEDW